MEDGDLAPEGRGQAFFFLCCARCVVEKVRVGVVKMVMESSCNISKNAIQW